MKFHKKLYVSSALKEKKEKICWKLKHRVGQLAVYVVVISPGDDQLEIFHCCYLKQKYYKKHPPYIVGIAESDASVLELLQVMVKDVLDETGTAHVKTYFLEKDC